MGASGLALAANLAVFLAAFGLLTARPLRIVELLSGVVLAAIGGWYSSPRGAGTSNGR